SGDLPRIRRYSPADPRGLAPGGAPRAPRRYRPGVGKPAWIRLLAALRDGFASAPSLVLARGDDLPEPLRCAPAQSPAQPSAASAAVPGPDWQPQTPDGPSALVRTRLVAGLGQLRWIREADGAGEPNSRFPGPSSARDHEFGVVIATPNS